MTTTLTQCKKQTAGVYTTLRNGHEYVITNDKYACYGYKWASESADLGEKSFVGETKKELLEDMAR